MSGGDYSALCARIRDFCRRRHWYGPDHDLALRRPRPCLTFNADGIPVEVEAADDLRTFRFAFPPATEEQLLATESALGVPLPPDLRAIYAGVANGGFGPASGIVGAIGGAPLDAVGLVYEHIAADPVPSYEVPDGLETEEIDEIYSGRIREETPAPEHPMEPIVLPMPHQMLVLSSNADPLPAHTGPEELLVADIAMPWRDPSPELRTFCDWGCGITIEVDLRTGRVYEFGYYDVDAMYVRCQALSVTDWLEQWMSGP